MQIGTFGGTPAADALDNLLRTIGDTKLTGKIGRTINVFQTYLKHLEDIQDDGFHDKVLEMLYKECLSKDQSYIPTHIRSYLNNYITALYRQNKRHKP